MTLVLESEISKEITRREVELAQLKELHSRQFQLASDLDQVNNQVKVFLQPHPFDGQAAPLIAKAETKLKRQKNDVGLFDVLAGIIGKPGTYVRPAILAEEALKRGYKTSAQKFYSNVIQLVRTDKRFRLRKVKGEKRSVEVTLREEPETVNA